MYPPPTPSPPSASSPSLTTGRLGANPAALLELEGEDEDEEDGLCSCGSRLLSGLCAGGGGGVGRERPNEVVAGTSRKSPHLLCKVIDAF